MPSLTYLTCEKVQIVRWYFGGHSANEIVNLFIVAFENRPIPSKSTIVKIISNFEKYGCVSYCRKCQASEDPIERPINDERQTRELNVCLAVETGQPSSSRQIAEEVDMDKRTVQNILKRNGYHCYKVQTTQEIFPEDNIRRMDFCEEMMERQNADENFLKNILFTDESTFSLHQKHNPSVTRYWSRENKHLTIPIRTQYPQKLNVWTGILGDHIIGPFFIEGNLNSAKYLDLLQNQVIPAVLLIPDVDLNRIWFQQDGCPAHNSRIVMDFLNFTFPEKIISTNGTIKWPPRSPELAPNDFFLWGFLKSSIYQHAFERANNLNELRVKIQNVCASITPNNLRDMRSNLYHRFGYCLAQQGGLFEHLIH